MGAPTASPDRQAFRAALAALATKTRARLPGLNGRIEKACKLVLAGDVELRDGGKALVHSLSDPGKTYSLEPGHCPCADFPRAPEYLCCHRLAAGFARKLRELVPPAPPAQDHPYDPTRETPLPEAPCSLNFRAMIGLYETQITLRDTNEAALLTRMQTLLTQPGLKPVPKPAPRHNQWRKGRA